VDFKDSEAPPDNVTPLRPTDSFAHVADCAKRDVVVGVIIGYSEGGELLAYGGGMLDGREPTQKDWLWMTQTFSHKLIRGDYLPE